jgi:hypothetical protein
MEKIPKKLGSELVRRSGKKDDFGFLELILGRRLYRRIELHHLD